MKKYDTVSSGNTLQAMMAALVITSLLTVGCYAEMVVPVMIGMAHPAVDEQGRLLEGGANRDASACDLVHILLVGNGIQPPLADGSPHPDNPLIAVIHIGNLASSALENPGVFACELALTNADLRGKQIVVRLFNAPSLSAASFYNDSEPTLLNTDRVLVDIATVDTPLYVADSDSDGLSDSWEMSYTTDKFQVDTDHDGMSDYDEICVGMSPTDATSVFEMNGSITDSGEYQLTWCSRSGIRYVVESASQLTDETSWTDLCEVDGAENETTCPIPEPSEAGQCYYRIKVRN